MSPVQTHDAILWSKALKMMIKAPSSNVGVIKYSLLAIK